MILKPKYNDEIIELNLDDPETVEKVTALVQKGMFYDKKGKTELDALREEKNELLKYKKWAEDYQATVTRARTDPEVYKAFVSQIETALGRSLTEKEKEDAAAGMFAGDDDDELRALKSEIAELRNAIKDTKVDLVGRDIKNINAQLSRKYNGADGLPKYDAEAVQRYIDEKGLYSHDLEKLYDDVYVALNREEIFKALKSKNMQGARDGVHIQSGKTGHVSIAPQVETKGKSYSRIAQEIALGLEKTGQSIVEPDE